MYNQYHAENNPYKDNVQKTNNNIGLEDTGQSNVHMDKHNVQLSK